MSRYFLEMAPTMSEAQLKGLDEHKYSASGTSAVEPVMQVFWRWLVEKVPLWVAPNLITLVGLIINVVTSLLLMYYSPTAKEEAPAWVYMSCAVGLFLYQSLDAIDGKQARRTGSSTPLGELFDHGCDSISTVFVGVATCCAMTMGDNPDLMFITFFNAVFVFYCAHWQTYVSGTLKFGYINVTEAQILIMAIHIVSAVFGTSIWFNKVPLVGLSVRVIAVICSTSLSTWTVWGNFQTILKGGAGKNGSTVAGTSVLSPGFPILFPIVLALMIYKKSSMGLFQNHPCLYLLMFGMSIGKITNKLVIAHMTKSEMTMFDSSMIGPGLLFLDQYFNSFINEYIVLWISLIFVTFDLVQYCCLVCLQICDHLDIYCFNITSKPSKKGLNSGNVSKATRGAENLTVYSRPRTRSLTRANREQDR
ncbi:cholinephosphotransferase 1-like isoform X2 [Branchiostoma floridae]|uniref:diacylglycerol cholinephosphotransferase n=1 Tax=Branchiostoma floridae TaxID=7739 RepID=A0A9J7KZI1_BRAFL|nr:cholinephosphotransferase 1-like isoform X2 [Branchiostoma floridae]